MGSITLWDTFVFLFVFSCFCMTLSHCGDTLKQGESIRDWIRFGKSVGEAQSLVSANQVFELGFFSPGKSNKRYVGIWYKKDPAQTIVWVANRQTPLPSTYSGSLTINTNGNLMILGIRVEESPNHCHGCAQNPKTRSRGISIPLSSVRAKSNSSLTLLDCGNLVFTERNEEGFAPLILWQSFDYPSDTYLPNMKLRPSFIGRSPMMLTSWRSKDDPSPGDFTLELDSSGAGQLSIWKYGKARNWTSGFWNGQIFTSIPKTKSYNFNYFSDENGSYFRYSIKNNSAISRLVMDVSGQIMLFTWSEENRTWRMLWFQPRGVCDYYAYCGSNGACNQYSSSPCRCLDGFMPRSRREWESNVWSSGCVRRTPLRCGERDQFVKMKMTRLPPPSDNFLDSNVQFNDCEAKCRSDC